MNACLQLHGGSIEYAQKPDSHAYLPLHVQKRLAVMSIFLLNDFIMSFYLCTIQYRQ